jgi:hypothetical protein
MNEEDLRVAEAMLKDTENYSFVGDVIDRLRIGRTAFYRYFPPDRNPGAAEGAFRKDVNSFVW